MHVATSTASKRTTLLRRGSAVLILAAALALSGCSTGDPQPDKSMGTAELGKEYATATPSASSAPNSPTVAPQPGSASNPYVAATVSPDAIDASALPPGVSTEEAHKLVVQAQDFVIAYHGLTYEDASPSAWKSRVAPVATDGYMGELNTAFPDNGSSSGWSDFQKNQTKQFASIRSARVGIGQSYNEGTLLITVNYTVCATSNGSAGTVVLNKYSRFVKLVRTGSEWKVASFKHTTGGGA